MSNVYTCYIDGGENYAQPGFPQLYQITAQYLKEGAQVARAKNAAVMFDHEPKDTVWDMEPQAFANTKAKARVRELNEWAEKCAEAEAYLRAALPERRLILYTNWPALAQVQYRKHPIESHIAASRRMAKTVGFDRWDAIAFSGYLSGDDRNAIGPAEAAKLVRDWIHIAREAVAGTRNAGKPLIVSTNQRYVGDYREIIPMPIRQAVIRAVLDAGCEVIDWAEVRSADEAAERGRDLQQMLREPAPVGRVTGRNS